MALDFWDGMEATGAVIFILCLVPQLVRTLQRGRAQDVSLWFLALVLVGSLVSVVWAMHEAKYFFTVSFAANLVVWGTVFYYRLRPRTQHGSPSA